MCLRIILLGSGDSGKEVLFHSPVPGKSTFFKQLKLRYLTGFSSTDYARTAQHLREITLSSMKTLLSSFSAGELFPPELGGDVEAVLSGEELNATVAQVRHKNAVAYLQSIEALWGCQLIRKTFEDRVSNGIQISSNSNYYFENAVRFSDPLYRPSNEDHFRVKMITTGVHELSWKEEDGSVVTVVCVSINLFSKEG